MQMTFERVLVTGAAGQLGSHVVAELDGRCRVSGLDLVSAHTKIPHRLGDITDPAALSEACRDVDAVIHIAARPNIWSGSGQDIVSTNTTGVWNVLSAAEAAGVKRVVLCSSDSVVGFTVASGSLLPPDYLPIDAAHPLRPTDAYGVSKRLGEEIGRAFAQRGQLEIVVLRPVFVLYPQMHGEVRARAADPARYQGPQAGGPNPAGGGPVWHYVDPRDAARAFRLALEFKSPQFACYFVSGQTTLAPEPTLERLRRYLGRDTPVHRPDVYRRNPFAPLYDIETACLDLGYEAQHDFRPALYPTTAAAAAAAR
jgi:nucleoside-diphosphate-sugar epimerase